MNFLDLTEDERRRYHRLQNSYMTSDTQDIQCPWCNQKQGLEWDDVSYEDDANTERQCDYCGKTFDIHTSVTYDFTTEIPDEDVFKEIESERKQ